MNTVSRWPDMLRTTFLVAALLAAQTGIAHAQDGDVEPRRSLALGLGIGFAPTYEGSDRYRATAFPIIQPSFGSGPSRVDFRGLDDIRIDLFPESRFRFGPVIGYAFGRDQDDDPRLQGLGDVDGGLVGGAFAGYDLISNESAKLGLSVAYSAQFTGETFESVRFPGATGLDDDYGAEIDFGASGAVALSDRLDLSGRAGLVYATDAYMDTHFGVVPAQALASGLAAYDPGAGLKSAYIRADLNFSVTDRFRLRAGLGYSRLLSDAADSPVVASRHQISGQLGASYTFRF